jgi:guanylate kinase
MADTDKHSPNNLDRRGLLFVLSSPSGAGKSTLSRMLLAADPEVALSVSCTTRPPRPGEVDGKDYFFVDEPTFKAMAKEGKFLEWAHVFGHRYGTPKEPVEKALEGPDVVRVFILPPSIDELERRLHTRAQDSDEVIADRMSRAKSEIGHWDGYDYVLINTDVEACFTQVQQILAAERLKRRRQKGLIGFVRDLAAG